MSNKVLSIFIESTKGSDKEQLAYCFVNIIHAAMKPMIAQTLISK